MRILIICIIVFYSLIPTAFSDESGVDEPFVISSFAFPPLLHIAKDGSFSGTLGETVKLICEQAKMICVFKVVPLKRAYGDLRNGKVDALITLDLNQFSECCQASKWVSPWSAGLFSTLPEQEIPNQGSDLYGKKLIVVNGMRSPYSFLPDMDKLADQKKVLLFKAKDIESSVLMFYRKRADFLWGGEDFKWYLKRIAPDMSYSYKPLFRKGVVLWVGRDQQKKLSRFNKAFAELLEKRAIGEDGLLIPYLMEQRYKEPS